MNRYCKTHGAADIFEQGQKTTYQLKETTSIENAANTRKCSNGNPKENLGQPYEFNSAQKGQHKNASRYQKCSNGNPKENLGQPYEFNSARKGQHKNASRYQDVSSEKSKLAPYVVNEKNNHNSTSNNNGKKNRSKVFPLILLACFGIGTSLALDQSANATIVTSPIIFGEDATLQCSFQYHRSLYPLSTKWLKGKDTKENIIYANFSTKGGKYTSQVNSNADLYLFLLTIHNVSLSDLDIYICECDFQVANVTFRMDENLSFIYFPVTSDIVRNFSASHITILIPMIYPQPNCTAVYDDKDVSKLLNKTDRREIVMYSTHLQINQPECCGNLNISCSLGAKSFNLSTNVNQNCKECLTDTDYSLWFLLIGGFLIIIIILIIVMRKKIGKKNQYARVNKKT